ncbi:ATPase involved in DNA repair/chromosome segregation [Giardia duodenalis]|uniref:ATPase involved in DNA repair/chromosome segregation n=1 Tax=Giardia intestinalis TaxID=5741 RepID=V6TYE4_GIAIN|nr:ATPase involved in DNA repair/chromosome segregation [Giardia intestinalis]
MSRIYGFIEQDMHIQTVGDRKEEALLTRKNVCCDSALRA